MFVRHVGSWSEIYFIQMRDNSQIPIVSNYNLMVMRNIIKWYVQIRVSITKWTSNVKNRNYHQLLQSLLSLTCKKIRHDCWKSRNIRNIRNICSADLLRSRCIYGSYLIVNTSSVLIVHISDITYLIEQRVRSASLFFFLSSPCKCISQHRSLSHL